MVLNSRPARTSGHSRRPRSGTVRLTRAWSLDARTVLRLLGSRPPALDGMQESPQLPKTPRITAAPPSPQPSPLLAAPVRPGYRHLVTTSFAARRRRSWTRTGNRIAVWLYRRFNGGLSSGGKDAHVLLITTPGRRTGIPRSACVRFITTSEGLVVWGTGSGSREDPDWFNNLRKAPIAQVQVRERKFEVTSRELVGEERDAMWRDTVLAETPQVMRYERRAGRTIPVAVLEPV